MSSPAPATSPTHPARSLSPLADKHTPQTPARTPAPADLATRVASAPSSREPTPAVDASAPTPAQDESDREDDDKEEADDETDAARTIDMETFHQILDLDEDDTHDFSKGMAWAYFTQASTTFVEMDEAYSKKDLAKLSSLGHFLKGSSAALGVAKVQASCEQIQHYGQLRDEQAGTDLTDTSALQKIGPLLTRVKAEYAIAETWLKKWYDVHCAPEEDADDS